jgi:hypothetical protein
MVENDVRAKIATLSTIPSTKINLGRVLRGTLPPYVVVSKLNADQPFDHSGDDGTSTVTMQVDVYDKDYKTCKGYAGELYALSDFTDTHIVKVKLANEVDLFDATSELFQVSLEFTIYRYTD